MKLGPALREIRRHAGFHQGEMSRRLGISQTYLSQIENERKQPSGKLLQQYSVTLRIPIQALLWFTLEPKDFEVSSIQQVNFNAAKPLIDEVLKPFNQKLNYPLR